MKVSVIGGGAWGTTLSQALSDNKHQVLIREINSTFVEKINEDHTHPFFDVTIPSSISATLSSSCAYLMLLRIIFDTVEQVNVTARHIKLLGTIKKTGNVHALLLISVNENRPSSPIYCANGLPVKSAMFASQTPFSNPTYTVTDIPITVKK